MKKICYLLLLPLFFACKDGGERLEISVNEIDVYVEQKLGDDQLYDVSQSLRFSHESETYEVVKFMQNDTAILFIETLNNNDQQVVRQIFYKNGLPVFVDELVARNITTNPFLQRRIYLDGNTILEAFEREASTESGLEFAEYEEVSLDEDDYDFAKPDRAMMQEGEFELKFEEFLLVGDQRYLILENSESDYDVALFVTEPTRFLVELETNPEKYVGKTIFVTHQFILMGSVERMLFVDGEFKDESLNSPQ